MLSVNNLTTPLTYATLTIMKKKDLLIRIERLESKVGKLEREMVDFRSVPLIVERKEYIPPTISPETFPNIICPHCGSNSGLSLSMVIPPEGLRCMSCGKICIQGGTVTYNNCEYHTRLPVTVETKPNPAQFVCENAKIQPAFEL